MRKSPKVFRVQAARRRAAAWGKAFDVPADLLAHFLHGDALAFVVDGEGGVVEHDLGALVEIWLRWDRFAAMVGEELGEQPWAAKGAAPDHNAGGAGGLADGAGAFDAVDVAIGDDGNVHSAHDLGDGVPVGAAGVVLGAGAAVHGDEIAAGGFEPARKSTMAGSRSSQPMRIFAESGTSTASRMARMMAKAVSGVRRRPEPSPWLATFGTGQPMFTSSIFAPAATASCAPSAMISGSEPKSCTLMGSSSSVRSKSSKLFLFL